MAAATDVNIKVRIFNETIVRLYDNYVPVRRGKDKRAPVPWMSQQVRTAMRQRDQSSPVLSSLQETPLQR